MQRLVLSFLALLPLIVTAQISLSRDNVPALGDTLVYARDTMVANVSVGTAGPDQVWDFSDLGAQDTFSLIVADAALDSAAASFPDADLTFTAEQVTTFIQINDTAVLLLGGGIAGSEDFGLDLKAVQIDPPRQLYTFPTSYDTAFTSYYEVRVAVPDVFTNLFDSIRLVRRSIANVHVDAYGVIKTRVNSYQSLRQRIEIVNSDSLYGAIGDSWIPLVPDTSIELQYQWLAAETKGNVLTMNFDEDTGLPSSIEYFLEVRNAGAPIANFSFSSEDQTTFQFTDESVNEPDSWEWTFGDGNSSNEPDPEHTYTVSGEYQVCLTVGNDIGTNQFCQTITADVTSNTLEPAHRIYSRVYPNPAKDFVIITPQIMQSADYELKLINQLGQTVLHRQQHGRHIRLQVSGLPSGAYTYLLSVTGRPQWDRGIIILP